MEMSLFCVHVGKLGLFHLWGNLAGDNYVDDCFGIFGDLFGIEVSQSTRETVKY